MSVLEGIERKVHYPLKRDVSGLGIGLLGAGGIVRQKHCPAYRNAGFNVVSVYDLDPDAAREAADEFSIKKVRADLDAFLADDEVQIVDIAIPNQGREEIMTAVTSAGKHILLQKPMADDGPQALRFVKRAEDAGVTLAINQNARWAPTYGAAMHLIASGVIGTPYWIHHQLLSGFDWTNTKAWQRELTRFQLHQYGIHHFDALARWTGRQPSRVYAHITRRPDQRYRGDMLGSVVCEYDSELQAYLQETNALHPSRPWATRFEIHGSRGCIVSSNLDSISVYGDAAAESGEHHQFEITWFPDAFVYPMYELMTAVLDNREPNHSGRSLLPVMRTLDAAYTSARDGAPVSIPGDAV